jgi:hypothetical protein
MTQASRGTFTQVPNIFLDTCDLPETFQIGFLRMMRLYAHRGGVFTGSLRKLSKDIHLPKSTVARMIPALVEAKLIEKRKHQADGSEREELVLILLLDDLWEQNKHHECPKLGQSASVPIWDTHVPQRDESVPPMDNTVPNWDESVPPVSTKLPPNTSNTNKKEEKEEVAASLFSLTDETHSQNGFSPSTQTVPIGRDRLQETQQEEKKRNASSRTRETRKKNVGEEHVPSPEAALIIENWRSLFHVQIPTSPALIKAAEQLAPCHPSVETLRSIKDYCYKNDRNGYYKSRGVKLWDIAREYEGWQSVQEAELHRREREEAARKRLTIVPSSEHQDDDDGPPPFGGPRSRKQQEQRKQQRQANLAASSETQAGRSIHGSSILVLK